MQKHVQIALLKTLLARLADKTNHDAGCQVRNPAASYVDPPLAQREWQLFFREHPQVVGMSGDLPAPGSYFTVEELGLPVLAVRGSDGYFRAFLNACRHRGAQLVEPGRGTAPRFVCPFHGWTYRNDGELAAVPELAQFGNVEKACFKLVELPAVERHGLLWIHPRPDGVLDVPALLGALDAEFASWNLGGHRYCGEHRLAKRANWKLANDTFGESYHFKRLHQKTLGVLAHGDAITFDVFGRNSRLTFPSKSIERLLAKPEERWRIDGSATVLYYLFPNIQITVSERQVTLFRLYPEGGDPGRSITRIGHYFSQAALDVINQGNKTVIGAANAYDATARDGNAIISVEAAMEVVNSTLEHEDFHMAEGTQRTAESGLVPDFLFGRNEAPLHHFHNTFRAALGMGPLVARVA